MKGPVAALLLCAMLAGCLGGTDDASNPATAACNDVVRPQTYWLGQGLALRPNPPAKAGRTDGNGASNTFATDEADEWRSDHLDEGIRIVGTVTLELWVESKGATAAYQDSSNPGQGWHFFTQFGSNRGFAGTYNNTYNDAWAPPGTVMEFTQTFDMPEGGHVVEAGDQIRLLLTSLASDGPDGGGSHIILWGGDTPSRITFEAACYLDREWELVNVESSHIAISGNQGALAPSVANEEGVNFQEVRFTLLPSTERITISLLETDKSDGKKDDMDVSVYKQTELVWSIGSPYADEIGTYWERNLDALMPPGDYIVRVDSYSGTNYEGTLTITQETSAK